MFITKNLVFSNGEKVIFRNGVSANVLNGCFVSKWDNFYFCIRSDRYTDSLTHEVDENLDVAQIVLKEKATDGQQEVKHIFLKNFSNGLWYQFLVI